MEVLMILPVLAIVMALVVFIGAFPLYLALKIVDVHEGFIKALIVNLIAGALSLVIGLLLNFIGIFLAGITNILSVFTPFFILAVVIQQAYQLPLGKAAIVALIQYVVSVVLAVAATLAIVIPLGIGAAAIFGTSGGL
jgi:hypothetical protein